VRPWLVLAVLSDVFAAMQFRGETVELSDAPVGNRRLVAPDRLVVVGQLLRRVHEAAFLGPPSGWLGDGEHYTKVRPEQLLWRPRGPGTWRAVAGSAPRGFVDFAVRRKGELTNYGEDPRRCGIWVAHVDQFLSSSDKLAITASVFV
jgi:hypothetical protein